MSVDLTPFVEENDRFRVQKRRVKWPERLDLIRNHFPGSTDVDWSRALRDSEVFAKVVRDLLKAQQHMNRPEDERSIAGRRPNIEPEEGMAGWRELVGRSYSDFPFERSFRLLAADRSSGKPHSLTQIARKTGISRSRVHRLLNCQEQPDLRDMEMIASAYGRKASFFVEYRVAVILGFIADRLDDDPEISTSLYQRIVGS